MGQQRARPFLELAGNSRFVLEEPLHPSLPAGIIVPIQTSVEHAR